MEASAAVRRDLADRLDARGINLATLQRALAALHASLLHLVNRVVEEERLASTRDAAEQYLEQATDRARSALADMRTLARRLGLRLSADPSDKTTSSYREAALRALRRQISKTDDASPAAAAAAAETDADADADETKQPEPEDESSVPSVVRVGRIGSAPWSQPMELAQRGVTALAGILPDLQSSLMVPPEELTLGQLVAALSGVVARASAAVAVLADAVTRYDASAGSELATRTRQQLDAVVEETRLLAFSAIDALVVVARQLGDDAGDSATEHATAALKRLTDLAVQRAAQLDARYALSDRAQATLQSVDARYGVTQQVSSAATVLERKYQISSRMQQTAQRAEKIDARVTGGACARLALWGWRIASGAAGYVVGRFLDERRASESGSEPSRDAQCTKQE